MPSKHLPRVRFPDGARTEGGEKSLIYYLWGYSSVGRALDSRPKGRQFKSGYPQSLMLLHSVNKCPFWQWTFPCSGDALGPSRCVSAPPAAVAQAHHGLTLRCKEYTEWYTDQRAGDCTRISWICSGCLLRWLGKDVSIERCVKDPADSELVRISVSVSGVIAQLVERPLRMRKAGSSNLPSSSGTVRRSTFLGTVRVSPDFIGRQLGALVKKFWGALYGNVPRSF